MTFYLPDFKRDNHEDDIWGPPLSSDNQSTTDLNWYAPFNKMERLGRPADWYEPTQPSSSTYQSRLGQSTSKNYHQNTNQNIPTDLIGNNSHDGGDDDASFLLVDRSSSSNTAAVPLVRSSYSYRNNKWQQSSDSGVNSSSSFQQQQQQSSSSAGFGSKQRGRYGGGGAGSVGGNSANSSTIGGGKRILPKDMKGRDTAVAISTEWKLVEEYPLSAFSKLSSTVGKAKDLAKCGKVYAYDRKYDRVNTRSDVTLKQCSSSKSRQTSVTASDDRKLVELGAKISSSNCGGGDIVYATGQVLAALMTAPRSLNGWDLIFRVVQNKNGGRSIFIDKREGGALDWVTVNETAEQTHESLAALLQSQDGWNNPVALATEATQLQYRFAQHVIDKEKSVKFSVAGADDNDNDDEEQVSIGYRYRQWNLRPRSTKSSSSTEEEEENQDNDSVENDSNERPLLLIARTEVESALDEDKLLTLRAFNEYYPIDPVSGVLQQNYVEWRNRLDVQRGAILATELRNNAWKFARWTVESVLAGAEAMKVGFVSRQAPLNPSKGYQLLGTQLYKPHDISLQLNIDMDQCWGIVRSLVEIILRETLITEEGKEESKEKEEEVFVLVKDAQQSKVRLYRVPKGSQVPGYPSQK